MPDFIHQTPGESAAIRACLNELKIVTSAMGGEQEFELLKARTMLWQVMREGDRNQDPMDLAEAAMIRQIGLGVEKKYEIGSDNDTFDKSVLAESHANAYFFGQKLVRWNRLLERKLLSRLLGKAGPLNVVLLLQLCEAANVASDSWTIRAEADL